MTSVVMKNPDDPWHYTLGNYIDAIDGLQYTDLFASNPSWLILKSLITHDLANFLQNLSLFIDANDFIYIEHFFEV